MMETVASARSGFYRCVFSLLRLCWSLVVAEERGQGEDHQRQPLSTGKGLAPRTRWKGVYVYVYGGPGQEDRRKRFLQRETHASFSGIYCTIALFVGIGGASPRRGEGGGVWRQHARFV